jgi:hypothetical protein
MSVSDAIVAVDEQRARPTQRLLVTEKDSRGLYRPVGFLDAEENDQGSSYEFAYLRSAAEDPEFRPLLGFDELHRRYRSDGLFPLFAERIMDPRRPDRPLFLAALDLTEEAGPLEVLARSGGRRTGDGILLIPVPQVAPDGATGCTFLVHGIRHISGASQRIDQLRPGDALCIVPNETNAVNPRALLVAEGDGEPLGWVPDALLEYVHTVKDPHLTVVRVNDPAVGTRLRLLIRLRGRASSATPPFTGPEWETVGA